MSPDAVPSPAGRPYASSGAGRFRCLFGRDSLNPSLQLLPAQPGIAAALLEHEFDPVCPQSPLS